MTDVEFLYVLIGHPRSSGFHVAHSSSSYDSPREQRTRRLSWRVYLTNRTGELTPVHSCQLNSTTLSSVFTTFSSGNNGYVASRSVHPRGFLLPDITYRVFLSVHICKRRFQSACPAYFSVYSAAGL